MASSNSNQRRGPIPPDQMIGRVLSERYEILSCVSTGKTASVFRARQLEGGEDVAIKILNVGRNSASEREQRLRFYREIQAAFLISHPHIVKIFEMGDTTDGMLFFVMEFLEGKALSELLRQEGQLPINRVVEIFSPVCEALQAAHSAGIIHRDVKPGNVFLQLRTSPDNPTVFFEWVKVLDFGIAKPGWSATSSWGSEVSGEGIVVGTPEYMSPEQCHGRDVTFQSDIYSLGVMLYKMLVGQTPFDGPTVAVMARHISTEPPPLRARRPNLPPGIENVVLKALAKDPVQRFQSALEFRLAFVQAVDQYCTPHNDQPYRTITPPETKPQAIATQTMIIKRPAELDRLDSGSGEKNKS
ncbi:MAG: serine/threonine protein kinase [Blastocatellia bacterium]|nr:serine/threonine protein kinase [Blastocatellia bacterium]